MSFKNILLPVDGSATALQAAGHAVELVKAFGGSLTLVCVVDSYPFTGVGADFAYGQVEYLAAANANAKAALDKAEELVKSLGVTPQRKIVEQHVVHEGILDTAKEIGADLIVMSSHGRQGLEKLLLGSEALRVLGRASVPVLVVRGPKVERDRPAGV
ncbi:MAG: putative universal stress protein [Paracidovorax wautersii]|uniref:Universal stress protein n=1 Tax=Paracidovorax wautersii TaxID=1177982 RepID=A0A7V8FN93_9BURK|nr:MAG: putative universal stress protein [Paracidovorax wautersii]